MWSCRAASTRLPPVFSRAPWRRSSVTVLRAFAHGPEIVRADRVGAGHEQREIVRHELLVGRQRARLLDRMLQLARVPGERVVEDEVFRLGREPPRVLGGFREHPQEVVGERELVLAAFPQRRHPERDDREAVVEVVAKDVPLDGRFHVEIRGGQDADVDRDVAVVPDAADLKLLERAQDLRLGRHRHGADLVEKERSALGFLEQAAPRVRGPDEGAAHVSEELALDEVVGDSGAVRA